MLKTRLSLILFGLLFSLTSYSQTLVAGDIAFIGYHEDATDQFTWIALTDIPAGEEIYFTEKGWNSTGNSWFINTEGHMRWVSPAGGVSCGTIVHINETAGNTFTVTGGGTATIALNSWSQSGGDQVLAYQGGAGVEPAAPVFIAGVHADYNSGDYNPGTTWNNGVFINVTSASMVPAGLTNLVNCVSLHPAPGPEFDCTHYDGTLTGTSAALRLLINNPANWGLNQTNSGPLNITASAFPVPAVICASPCTDPDVPTITAGATTICPGGSTTLNWTGASLNDATNWHIYTTSCGVGQLGSPQTGTTLLVSPAVTTTYYIRGEDGAGCVDESSIPCGSVTVTVQDITNPTITCPGNQVGTVDGSCNYMLPDYTSLAVAADNCTASPTVTQSPVPGTVVGTGTTVITLTATDASANSANCNFNVVVSDNTNPTIACPGNQVGSVGASCTFVLPDYTPLATPSDNCPGVVVTQVPAPGTIVGAGTTNVVLTATDGASNTANCNFDVVVSDNTNPTITCPGNQVGSVDGSCNFSLPDYTALATPSDNCPGVVVTQVPAPGTIVGTGTTNIVLTATDGASNTANCNFDVVVSDNTNPTITCPGNQVGSVDGSCNFTLPDYTPLATPADNCPGVTVTQVPAPGTIVGVGTTNIVLTATDGGSNTANCNFDVVVSDNTNPTIACPGNQVGSVGASCTFVLPDYTPLATPSDNCPGVVVTQVPAPGTIVGVGTTNIVFTATDGASNTANCNFDVVISDNTNPTIACPGNQTGSVDGSCNFSLPDYTALATPADNCPGVVVTQVPAPGTIVGAGTTNVVLTATDGASNTANCNFDVVVSDNTNPTAVCQDINVYLDGTGNASIVSADIDGGSTDNCGTVNLSASQTTFSCADLMPVLANDLIITAAYDGPLIGGLPKGVELYVVNNIADLSQYGIGSANNGGGTDGEEFTFPAVSATAGQFIYVSSEAVEFASWFGFAPDYTTTAMLLNGDDAVELFYMGGVIDVFGDINVDGTGQPWEYLDGWASRNNGTGPDGTVFTLGNWTFSGINVLDGETSNATAATPVPIGTYSIGAVGSAPVSVTLTVDDGNGNTDNCTATVTVNDTISPTITCPGNQTETPDAACNFTLPDYTGLTTSADNCTASPTVTQSPVAGTVISGTTTITMTSTDAGGNTSTCTFDVVLNDATPPTAVCQNINVYLDGAGNASIVAADVDGGSTDNCSGLTLTASQTAFTCADLGPNNVTLTVTDGNANSSNCVAVVTVIDTVSPSAVCQNINAYLDGAGNVTIVAADIDGGSTDNCGAVTLSASATAFTCADLGPNNVTLTADDGNGNASNCVAVVTVIDTISPSAVCQNINAYLDGAGNVTIVAADIDGGSTDNCGVVTVSASATAFTCADLGPNNVTLTADDGNGNTSSCVAVVTVIDTISPSAVCQNINAYLDGAGNVTIVAADIDGGSNDNCGTVTLSATATAFTCADIGPNNVTLTIDDGNGNTDNCVAVVTVLDTVSPTIICPGNQMEFVSPTCDFVLPDYTGLATGIDNCGTVTITQSPAAGTVITAQTEITLTANDGNGNSSSCTFNVMLTSAGGPTAICQDINVYLDAAGNATITAADIDGGSSVQCGALTFVASQTAFTCADLGPNTVTLSVTAMGNGLIDACDATVTIIDTISPVVTCPGNQVEIASAICDFVLPDYTGLVIGTDNCGSATITQSPVAGTTITADQTITMTADDGNGNTSTCTFDVNLDVTACAGVECSNAIALAPMDPCGDTQNVTGSTVGGTPQTEGTCGTSAGSGGATWYTFTGDGGDWTASTVSAGTNYDTKLWIFEGACGALNCITGNDDFVGVQSQVTFATTAGLTYYVIVGGFSSSEGTYDMTISNVETEAPVADVPVLADINGVCEITSLTDPTATDNCSAVTVTNNALLPITTNTTITWTYTDAVGNFSTQTQEVVLTDLVAPTASNPLDLNVECAGDAPIDVTVVTDEADNCSGAITVTHVSDVLSGNGCQDTITRTYNVADGSGNNIDVVQMIYIEDMTAPTASNPLDLNVQCIGDVPAPATGWVTDEADNCGTPTVTWTSDVSDGQSCPETITRTFTVTDNCGNSVDVVQMVIVMDVDPPLFDIASLPELTGNCDITPATATATDNCDGAMNGTPDVTFPITALGTTTVTWTFVDACGNTDSQTQDVTITAIDVTTSMAPDNITIQANNQGQTYQWIDCVSGLPVAGATNFNFTPSYGSNFAVIITENGCSDTSACVNSTVGIDDLQLKSIILYPNPTSGIFNVQFEGEIKNIEVLDMLGRVVSLDIDLTNGVVDATRLESGKYMIRLTSGNDQIFVEEFVIQK